MGPYDAARLAPRKRGWYAAKMDDVAARQKRALARANWSISAHKLGEEPLHDLRAHTTPSERVAMVWRLTQDAWAMSGRPMPDYARADAPGRMVRKA
jgi:hypothetical protein